MRKLVLRIFLCETDRKDNNGMKFIDAEDCVSIDIMMTTDITETDVRKRQGDVHRRLRQDQPRRNEERRDENRQRQAGRQD